MKTVAFTEFRRRASSILDLVEKGETVRILRHGKEIAEISAPRRPSRRPSWAGRFSPLVVPGASLSRAILEERRARD